MANEIKTINAADQGEDAIKTLMEHADMFSTTLKELAERAANTPLNLPKPEELGIKEIEVAKNKYDELGKMFLNTGKIFQSMGPKLEGDGQQWIKWSGTVFESFSNTLRGRNDLPAYIGFVGTTLNSLSSVVGSNGEKWLAWSSTVVKSLGGALEYKEDLAGYLDRLGDTMNGLADVVGSKAGVWLKWSSTVVKSFAEVMDDGNKVVGYFHLLSASAKSLGEVVGSKAGVWLEWSSGVVESFTKILDGKDQLGDYFTFLGETMGSLSGVIGDNAGKWLEWGANIMQAVGIAITQIMALIPAKEADAAANAKEAATGGAASVASIPFVGYIMAGVAIASVLAAIATIPGMANGGIAYGPTMAIFGEYAGAGNNPEVVAPLNKLRTLIQPADGGGAGRVEFKIQGRDLVGMLHKMNTINNRVNG